MMRPLVRLAAVMSIDGKLYPEGDPAYKIGSAKDRERLLSLRSDSDAILIGRNTLLIDSDAKISGRTQDRRRKPVNAVCASRLDFDHRLPFFQSDAVTRILFTTDQAREEDRERFSARSHIVVTQSDNGRVDISDVLGYLHRNGVQKLLLEGGGTLNHSFFKHGYIDEIHLTLASVVLAGERNASIFQGTALPLEVRTEFSLDEVDRQGPELFLVYRRHVRKT